MALSPKQRKPQADFFKIQKEQSEMREKLGLILLTPEAQRTPEQRAEQDALKKRQPTVEGEFQSALATLSAEQEKGVIEVDTEARELQRLSERANVGDILSAAFEKRQTTGETSEIQQHFKLGSHQVPLEMLRINRAVEDRAAATVPASIGDASQGEVITPVFATGDGAFMSIERPVAAVGDAAYPVLSTTPSVKGPFSDSSEAAQTDATFVANSLAPERLQASFSYRRTDAARAKKLSDRQISPRTATSRRQSSTGMRFQG